jgi:predicted dehydrogenase
MNRPPVGIGIIGCGNVLEAYVPPCQKLEQRGLARVVVACGRPPQEARALALGAPAFVTDERLVFDHREVELVLVLASMPEHARLVRAGLAAGKHVLVEKPLATNLSEAAELIALARARKKHLVSAPFTILSPTFQAIAARVQQGEIGKPCLARARYGWAGPWWSEWFYRPGGGCIFDLAVYCITTLTGLLGPAKRVMAMTGIAIPEREINGRKIRVEAEDNTQITIEFQGGALGTIMSGFTMQQYRSPAVEIFGTTGAIQMLGDDWDPDGYELWRNDAGCWQTFKETMPDWSWTDGLRHLIECLHAGTAPLVAVEHAYHVLEIMLLTQRSGKLGTALPIESSFTTRRFDETGASEPAHLMHDRSRVHIDAGQPSSEASA